MDNTFQLFPCDYKVPCQTHQCFGRGAFYIGRPNQKHTGTLQILCETCANELVSNILTSHGNVEVNADPITLTKTESTEEILLPFEPTVSEILEIDGVPANEMTVKELKAVCKDLGITGYSDKDKEELISLIDEHTKEGKVE